MLQQLKLKTKHRWPFQATAVFPEIAFLYVSLREATSTQNTT
jgi:hypothetical protein